MFLRAGCSLLRAEGYFCSWNAPHGSLGINKQQFFIVKNQIFLAVKFYSFGHQNSESW